ncbi:DNA-processing protein DprA [Halomonas sp. Mc5H-6]|uniref:DNA-processing protein DprA n=1 Tax=Halomonas sp. Mc5H-6 TaxID=2954500 RepID=UPI00209836E2|nr:DNA-processing protein DprA [Halomonas sp. Mc5H-6]MCO7246446.1 DNA-processing protein DprA [Halomonas sp. Mc5H-6]
MDTREWLVVNALPGVGPQRIAELVAQQPQWPQGWLAGLPSKAASALRLWCEHPTKSPLQREVEASLTWQSSAPGRTLLHRDHPAWPRLLNQLPDPPAVLWAQGDLGALERPTLAMVGTRRPTSEGTYNAQTFARELARRGWSIVSGMALGIDGVAQQAALDAGGSSVAVLGCGIDVIYPARHRALYQQLSDAPGGLVLAEHPPGTTAHPAFFPRRNRIVTGLSLGTLVVEAAEKSGSLVSARLAMEQGRDVFALPSSLHNQQARGCLQLLRQGAAMACEPEDIVNELQHWAREFLPASMEETSTHRSATDPAVEPLPDALLGLLSASPTPIDALVQQSGCSVSDCQQRLLMLEIEGWVASRAGGWVRLPRP